MQITRRSILSLVGAASFAPAFAGTALADNTDPNSPFAQRSLGSPTAPVKAPRVWPNMVLIAPSPRMSSRLKTWLWTLSSIRATA